MTHYHYNGKDWFPCKVSDNDFCALPSDPDIAPAHGIARPTAVSALALLRSFTRDMGEGVELMLDIIEDALEVSGYYEQLDRPLH